MFQRLFSSVFVFTGYDDCDDVEIWIIAVSRQPSPLCCLHLNPSSSITLNYPSVDLHPTPCNQNRTHRRVWYHSHPKHPPPRQWLNQLTEFDGIRFWQGNTRMPWKRNRHHSGSITRIAILITIRNVTN
jgi:hypothetical protein